MASGSNGSGQGGRFVGYGVSGVGVSGAALHNSGTNYGVKGETNSPNGYAGYFKGGRNYFEGDVGIGTDAPEYPLHVHTDQLDGIYAETTSFNGYAVRGHVNSAVGAGRGGSFESGCLGGIGVYGTASSATGTNYGAYGKSSSSAGCGVQGEATSSSGTTYGVRGKTKSSSGYAGYFEGGRNYFQGRVGIGTTAPGTDVKLQLAGANANIRLRESGGNPYVELGDTNAAKGYLQWFSSTNKLLLYSSGHLYPVAIGPTATGGVYIATENSGSNVGIATESPQYKLHVNGSAGKPGGGSWSNSSDRRLKKNIRDLTGSLDQLMKLRSVRFEYKDPEAIDELPGTRLGMIAQEVEEVFPDWVSEGGHGYKTVTFRGFEALTVSALRELREEKDTAVSENF